MGARRLPLLLLPALFFATAACSRETTMQRTVPCLSHDDSRYAVFSLAPDVEGAVFYEAHPSLLSRELLFVRQRMVLGVPCAGAANKNACLATLASMAREKTDNPGWSLPGETPAFSGSFDFALVTRGSEVIRIRNGSELGSMVAPIERDAEAVALLQIELAEPAVVCGASNVTPTAEGYWVKTLWGEGCERTETLYTVRRDGVIEESRTQSLESCSESSDVVVSGGSTSWWDDNEDVGSDPDTGNDDGEGIEDSDVGEEPDGTYDESDEEKP